jgi:hypothetical protein
MVYQLFFGLNPNFYYRFDRISYVMDKVNIIFQRKDALAVNVCQS